MQEEYRTSENSFTSYNAAVSTVAFTCVTSYMLNHIAIPPVVVYFKIRPLERIPERSSHNILPMEGPKGMGSLPLVYGPPTNGYVAYTVIRRKTVFICSASCAVYTVIACKIGFM